MGYSVVLKFQKNIRKKKSKKYLKWQKDSRSFLECSSTLRNVRRNFLNPNIKSRLNEKEKIRKNYEEKEEKIIMSIALIEVCILQELILIEFNKLIHTQIHSHTI